MSYTSSSSSPVHEMTRESLVQIFNDMDSTMRSMDEISSAEERNLVEPPGSLNRRGRNTVGSYLRAAMDAAMDGSRTRKNTQEQFEQYDPVSPAPVKSEEDREKIEYLREYAKQILATTVVKSPREYVLDEFYERMERCAKIKTKLETMLNVTPTSSTASTISKWKFVRETLQRSPRKTEWFSRRITEMTNLEDRFRDGVRSRWSEVTTERPFQDFEPGVGSASVIQGEILDRNISRVAPETLVRIMTPLAIPQQAKQNTNRLVELLHAYDRNNDEKLSFKEFCRATRHFVGATESVSEDFYAACTYPQSVQFSSRQITNTTKQVHPRERPIRVYKYASRT